MSRGRRKFLVRIVAGAALGLVALDIVVYFAVVRPLRSARLAEEARYAATRDRVRTARARLDRLQKFKAAVPEAEGQLGDFLKEHVPSRRQGFSRAAQLTRELSDASKVHWVGITYKYEPASEDPLARLGLEVEVDGTFPNLMSFAHAMETSDEFLVLRDFTLEPGEGRVIAMRLGADLLLKP